MKKLLLRTMLLLCALVAGCASVWATDVTFTPGTDTGATSVTKGDITVILTTMNNTDYYQIYANQSGTFTCSGGNITKIEFTCTASGTAKYGPGNASADGGTYSYDGTKGTWTGSASSITISSTQQVRMTSLTITYATSDTRTLVSASSLSFSPTTLTVGSGLTSTATASHDTPACTTGSFTYESLDPTIATCTSAGVISPVAKGTARIKATLSIPGSDENYRVGTATITESITIANPSHKATFYVNGTKDSETNVEEGADIVFPADPASIIGKDFVGWTTTAIVGSQNSAPADLTTPAIMGDADVIYYAVFATVVSNVPASWTETALSAMTASDVLVISGGSYAMTNDKGASNAPATASITVAEGKITSTVADNIKWNVSGSASSGYTFYPNGTTSTWLYCNTEAASGSNNNIRVGTGGRKTWELNTDGYMVTKDDKTARYLSIYNSQDFRGYVNTSNGAFIPKFYKYVAPQQVCDGYCTTVATTATITLAAACTDGAKCYGTYSNSSAFIVPSGLTVSEIGVSAGKLDVSDYAEGAVVPANTGVMISSSTAGEHSVTLATGGTSVLGSDNLLKATGSTGVTASDMTTANPTAEKFYRLTMHNGTTIGFWWGAASGAAFALGANKAYLAVPNAVTAPEMMWFDTDEVVTGVNDVRSKMSDSRAEVYNLAGQRVAQPTKGLYIVNGRKVVVK